MATKNQKSTNGRDDSAQQLPVVIAGGGCVGLFLALLLCQSDIPNKVIVIEPWPPSPSSTRAMAHQPLIFPLFSSAGLMPDLARLGSFSSGLCFRKSVKNGSELIAGKKFGDGDKRQLLLPQYKFQELLMEKVNDTPHGRIMTGNQVVGFEQHENSVSVRISPARDPAINAAPSEKDGDQEAEQTIEAAYLVGADGAHSTIRRLLSLSFDGLTLPSQLVATDIKYDFHAHGFYDSNFIIDPEDYGLIGRIDDSGLWRVSYGVSADTAEDEIHKGVHEKLERMLPGGRNATYEVKKVAPYKAQQRVVGEFWREGGRVGVLGDAAHLTNPYAGLGLASGIADASSLAQVLIRILSPSAPSPDSTNPAKLLSSWSAARRSIFLDVVDKASRAAYRRVQSRVDTEGEVGRMLETDPLVGALDKGMPIAPPSLVTRGEELEGW